MSLYDTNISGETKAMTDLDRFVALYKDLGIELQINNWKDLEPDKEGFFVMLSQDPDRSNRSKVTYDARFTGYSGFWCDISFDKNGKFIEQGFWE